MTVPFCYLPDWTEQPCFAQIAHTADYLIGKFVRYVHWHDSIAVAGESTDSMRFRKIVYRRIGQRPIGSIFGVKEEGERMREKGGLFSEYLVR